MTCGKLDLGSLETTLDKIPFALTLSNLSAPEQPLIFFNRAFRKLTGCSEKHEGQNCRFLQADFENTAARAEIRLALKEKRRTQVILRNARVDTQEPFSNLLLLEHLGEHPGLPEMAMGTQFVLTASEERALTSPDNAVVHPSAQHAHGTALNLRLERRRIISNSALSLLKSWCVLNTLVNDV